MLEKIGLPAKPSLRGNTWVVDATHCQGCSSQFTFINRKHHCRRCGGLFCNSCTQQRMVLRGQGDSPVRICEPCKKLEEAARFEMRHGYKNRAGKGSSKPTAKYEDEILNQILGTDAKESSSSSLASNNEMASSIQRAISSASCSDAQAYTGHDVGGEMHRSHSVDVKNSVQNEMTASSPEELRQRALDEKKKYKSLKGEGKSEEALKAFKRGKELERQAEALEIAIRRNRRKALSSGNIVEMQNSETPVESAKRIKLPHQVGEDKDGLAAELRELGWSDMDLRDDDKKSANMSLEGELSSLLGEVSKKANSHGTQKTEVVALKKKALMLKREGKLVEAKEELKRAKILEKQLEEQELLVGAEDSDDELSAIVQNLDNDEQDTLLVQDGLNFDHLAGTTDDLGMDSNFEVTEKDMEDPELAAALKSLGWTEDSNNPELSVPQSAPFDRETLLSQVLSLKREALNQKRAGNVAEAMAQLKKAKLLERDLDSFDSQDQNLVLQNCNRNISTSQTADKPPSSIKAGDGKSRLMIQKELLGLKKKALALRREGRVDEAEEELKKGKILERQLEEMDNASSLEAVQVNLGSKDVDFAHVHPNTSESLPDGGADVTDQDLHDPTYLSILRNLGWNDEEKDSVQDKESSVTQAPPKIQARASRRSKAELQRELLGLKRKALALRRQGNTDEAEEVLQAAKALEAEMSEMEGPKRVVESNSSMEDIANRSLRGTMERGDEEDFVEKDMNDPALLSVLNNLGWKDEEAVIVQEQPSKELAHNSSHPAATSGSQSSSGISVPAVRSRGEIQRELLGLKRKALALRRKGQTEEAEELLKMAKVLEEQLAELEAPKAVALLDESKDKISEKFESLTDHEKHGNLNDEIKENKGPVAVAPSDKVVQSSMLLGKMESDPANPPLTSSDSLILATSQPTESSQPLLDLGPSSEIASSISSSSQPVNLVDLLTGDDWTNSQIPAEKVEDDEGRFSSNLTYLAGAHGPLGSLESSHEDLRRRDQVTIGESKVVQAGQKLHIFEANSVQENASQSQNNQDSLRQQVLSHKRKAVALKREGKLAEAREELRQAKLLERSIAEDGLKPKTGPSDASASASSVPSDAQKEHGASNLAPKPASGRDRFKLQQESLSHKRQALKLRREGRLQEAEAEFELAKALEAQLEELTAHDSSKSSSTGAEPIDDVVVEDLLDPQLLSALKAIGLDDAGIVSRDPERTEPVKASAAKSVSISQERIQLEERIRAEKVKAVNLKRAGKQAEALDALRKAKLFEKKLNSLVS